MKIFKNMFVAPLYTERHKDFDMTLFFRQQQLVYARDAVFSKCLCLKIFSNLRVTFVSQSVMRSNVKGITSSNFICEQSSSS
jgi:hypothetical protein